MREQTPESKDTMTGKLNQALRTVQCLSSQNIILHVRLYNTALYIYIKEVRKSV